MNSLILYLITLLVGFFAGSTCMYIMSAARKKYINKNSFYSKPELDDTPKVKTPVSRKDYIERTAKVLRLTITESNFDNPMDSLQNQLHTEA